MTVKIVKLSALLLVLSCASAFSPTQQYGRQSFALLAKKGKKSGAKGFGKKVEAPPKAPKPQVGGAQQNLGGFSSIEETSEASFAKPQMDIDIDPNLPTNERNKEILRQQFGLRSYEEQQGDIRAAEKAAENQKRLQQIKQMKDEEFDIFMVIPPPIIKAIDAFLKVGLSVTTMLFVLAGVGITAEAWSVATNNNLPENVDQFIVNVIEPNFTTGLLVLLSFSISLGLFATAQLGSGSSIYKEEP